MNKAEEMFVCLFDLLKPESSTTHEGKKKANVIKQ